MVDYTFRMERMFDYTPITSSSQQSVAPTDPSPVRLTQELLRKLNSFSIEEKICFALDNSSCCEAAHVLSDMQFEDDDDLSVEQVA